MIEDDAMSGEQVVALVACMLSTAHVNGVRPEEAALIQRFYEGSAKPGMPTFGSLEGSGARALVLLSKVQISEDFTDQLVLMCLMTGYADGHLSAAEHAHVLTMAASAGVSEERCAQLLVQVKDSLIHSLAHLPDAESVAALAKTL